MARVVGSLLALAVAAVAGDIDETVRAVIDARAAGDAAGLARLVAREGTDPWLVADGLVARGALETAAAYAAAVSDRRARRDLARYLASPAAQPEPGLRETWRAARTKRLENDPTAALVLLSLVEPAASVVGVRMAHERAAALRDLGRKRESVPAFVAAGRLAHELGWLRRRNFLLRRVCGEHFNGIPYTNDATRLPARRRKLDERTAEVVYGWLARDLVAVVATRAGIDYVPLESRIDGAAQVLDYSATSPASLMTELRRRFLDPLDLDAGTRWLLVTPPPSFRVLPFAAFVPERVIAFQGSGARDWESDEAVEGGHGVVAVCDADGLRRDEALAAGTVVLGPGIDAEEFRTAVVSGVPWRAVHLACSYSAADRAFVLGGGPFGRVDRSELDGAFEAELLAITGDAAHRLWRIRTDPPDRDAPARWLTRPEWRTQGVLQLGEKVPRVLLPCWQPDSDATRALVLRFYALWSPGDGEPGIPAAEALQRAQAYVRGQARWRHPYYWAGWQLWGRID